MKTKRINDEVQLDARKIHFDERDVESTSTEEKDKLRSIFDD